MASIKKRPNGQWRARYRDAEGKEHAGHFERRVDGQRWLDEQTAGLVTGQYVDPRAGRITLRTYGDGWESSNVAGEAQARIVDNARRLHINPVLGDHAMLSIRHSDVQGLIKGLTADLGPGSIRNVYEVLARIMAAAVYDKVIASTPCTKKIALPPAPDVEVVPPTVEQVQALATTIPDRYRGAVVLLAGSGLRIGELLGLRVSDVDFLRRTVRVDRQRLQDGRIAPPKTAKSTRTVPLGQVVIDELAAHLAAFPSDEWLFVDELERPVTYRWWKRAWGATHDDLQDAENEAAKAAKRKPVTLARITTHDLRHFFASALIAGGASVKQVQTVLGHSSAVITLRVYSHLWPGDEDRTRSIVDATLGVLRTGRGLGDLAGGSAAGQGG